MKIFTVAVIICSFFVLNVNALCNVCGSSGVACISENQFRTCSGGVMVHTSLHECSIDTVCVSSDTRICVSTAVAGTTPSCEICNKCSPDLRFACITKTEYAYCFGMTTPSTTVVDTCPTGSICDVTATAPNFCSTVTDIASCPLETAEPPPITTQPPVTTTPTPTAQCIAYGRVGRYVILGTGCKKYINCYVFNGNLLGTTYTCAGTTLFDNALGLCVDPSYACEG